MKLILQPPLVDTGLYATPWAITYLTPIKDNSIVYSFHMYEPYAYTTRKINNERFTYPGSTPLHLEEAEQNTNPNAILINWNTGTLKQFLSPVVDWQKKYNIPASRILVGEFGCDRTSKGAEKYLSDHIDIFNFHNWHWLFILFEKIAGIAWIMNWILVNFLANIGKQLSRKRALINLGKQMFYLMALKKI